MIRRPPRSTQSRSSAASDVYKRQNKNSLFYAAVVVYTYTILVLLVYIRYTYRTKQNSEELIEKKKKDTAVVAAAGV